MQNHFSTFSHFSTTDIVYSYYIWLRYYIHIQISILLLATFTIIWKACCSCWYSRYEINIPWQAWPFWHFITYANKRLDSFGYSLVVLSDNLFYCNQMSSPECCLCVHVISFYLEYVGLFEYTFSAPITTADFNGFETGSDGVTSRTDWTTVSTSHYLQIFLQKEYNNKLKRYATLTIFILQNQ